MLLHKSRGRRSPLNVIKKRTQVGQKLLVSWLKIIGTFIKFDINFTILQKKLPIFSKFDQILHHLSSLPATRTDDEWCQSRIFLPLGKKESSAAKCCT